MSKAAKSIVLPEVLAIPKPPMPEKEKRQTAETKAKWKFLQDLPVGGSFILPPDILKNKWARMIVKFKEQNKGWSVSQIPYGDGVCIYRDT